MPVTRYALLLTIQGMTLFGVVTTLIGVAATSLASELSVLAGYQFNSDFSVTDEVATAPPPQAPGRPGETIRVDQGGSFALALDLDIRHDPTGRVGIYYSRHSTGLGSNAGLDDDSLQLSVLHFTGTRQYDMGGWTAFATAGLGATMFDPDDASLDSKTEFSLQVGAGALYPVTDHLLIRLDARWLPVLTGTGIAGFCSGGCVIAVESDFYHQVQLNVGLSLSF